MQLTGIRCSRSVPGKSAAWPKKRSQSVSKESYFFWEKLHEMDPILLYWYINKMMPCCPSHSVLLSLSLDMSILNYFKRKDSSSNLPLGTLPSTSIAVNRNVQVAIAESTSRKRGSYRHYSNVEKLQIGRHAAINGNASAMRAFEKKMGFEVSESTVRTFKKHYQRCLEEGSITAETPISELEDHAPTPPKRGRKTLLGDME